MFLSYLLILFLGWLLLCLPFSNPVANDWVDGAFTAASALSITGLNMVDISGQFTFSGQVVILLLIQIGGIGYMTVATTTVLYVHHKFSKDEHDLIQSDLNIPNHYRFEHIVKTKIWLTLIVEISGAVILYVLFFREQVDNAVWQLIFHSISAFCIAGMSLFPSNLEDFKHNYSIQFVIIGLSVIGLLGFIVFSDFYCMMRYKKRRLIITSKIILTMLGIVVVLGTGPRCLIDLVYDRYFGV